MLKNPTGYSSREPGRCSPPGEPTEIYHPCSTLFQHLLTAAPAHSSVVFVLHCYIIKEWGLALGMSKYTIMFISLTN